MTMQATRPGSVRLDHPFTHAARGELHLQHEGGAGGRTWAQPGGQMFDSLEPKLRQFVSEQEMFFLATVGRDDYLDCIVRTGTPGFVQVPDRYRLYYPEFGTGGLVSSMGSVRENPSVALLFLGAAGDSVALHVTGCARVFGIGRLPYDLKATARTRQEMQSPGERPTCWVEVTVQAAFVGCSSQLPRVVALPAGSEPARWSAELGTFGR